MVTRQEHRAKGDNHYDQKLLCGAKKAYHRIVEVRKVSPVLDGKVRGEQCW